ncbi:site-specific integrase [Sulfurovum sp. XTW-4]|uniref:Site-specific integrase n=1 Tax=Sulfurovum xiamenensis TaxID=3019066 RepID=A0ABT7QR79_9BACT|nr:site-specific integrase [Sulfurovum xiamenensis]MDM5263571.1 site-specific integrase [Sulfurovum xiamenensis]
MNFRLETVPHPKINNRDITFILENNDIHLPAAKFLAKEARSGGKNGTIGGITSHLQRAKQLRELFHHLQDIGINWHEATESDIISIRNAMLHWDSNDNPDKNNKYDYKKIKNNTMNSKLSVWFKFFQYMQEIEERCDIVLSTKLVKINKYSSSMKKHIEARKKEVEYIEVWDLMVPSDHVSKTFKTITRKEFEYFSKKLREDDVVYEMIALVMATTGLRIDAALKLRPDQFRSYFRYFHSGKSLNSKVSLSYIGKGDKYLECKIPLRTIHTLKGEYLNRAYTKRLKNHGERSKRGLEEYNNKYMWFNSKGRPINATDVRKAFKKASLALGRTQRPITPHWLRHSFATWALIDFSVREGVFLKGTTPDPLFITLLADLLGHADEKTTMQYVRTAIAIIEMERLEKENQSDKYYDGPLMTFQLFREDPGAQAIVKQEAIDEFGEKFDEKLFDPIQYAQSRGMLVDNSY